MHLCAFFGVDVKSGGTACFHVLMMDEGAFSFVKKTFVYKFQEVYQNGSVQRTAQNIRAVGV